MAQPPPGMTGWPWNFSVVDSVDEISRLPRNDGERQIKHLGHDSIFLEISDADSQPARTLITADELWEMPEVPGKRFELVKGELIELPGAGLRNNLIAALVFTVLNAFVCDHDLGLVFTDGAGYVLRAPHLMRIPDVSFVSWAQVPEEGLAEGFGQVAPALAVESGLADQSSR